MGPAQIAAMAGARAAASITRAQFPARADPRIAGVSLNCSTCSEGYTRTRFSDTWVPSPYRPGDGINDPDHAMSRPKCQPGPIGLERSASCTRSAERDRSVRDWRRNNRTDDRLIGVRSQPLVCGKVQNLRGIDRRRATRARPSVNDTITHNWFRRRKIQLRNLSDRQLTQI